MPTHTKKTAKKSRPYPRKVRNTTRKRYIPRIRDTMNLNSPPHKGYVVFRYTDTYHLASAIGSPATQIWKSNSLYDPDATGTGHQPYMFDQLCTTTAFFQYYKVNKCVIKVTGSCNSAGTGCASVGLLATRKSALSYTAPWNWKEENDSKYIKTCFVTDDTSKFKCSIVTSPRDVMGISKSEYDDITFQSIYNADPSTLTYVWLSIAHPDNTTVVTADIVVEIIYYAQLFNSNQMPSS